MSSNHPNQVSYRSNQDRYSQGALYRASDCVDLMTVGTVGRSRLLGRDERLPK